MTSFVVFLAAFLSLYGLLHAYVYIHVHYFFSMKRPWSLLIAALFLLLLFCPVLGQVLAARGWPGPAVWTLYAGYEWMAFLFLLVSALVVGDGLRLLLALAGRATGRGRFGGMPRVLFVAAAAVATAAFVYGHFEARTLRVDRVERTTSKLPAHVNELRVVQVSDLHFSAVNDVALAEGVARAIRSLEPDLLVATGDLVDRGMTDPDGVAGVFRSIRAPLGRYAVTGNHEFYHGIEASVRFLRRAGFRVLRGEAVRPRPWLSLAGVDDEAADRFDGPEGLAPEALLRQVPSNDLVLFLRHRPRVPEALLGRFDLQLSGHTHGGQIFPFGLVVGLAYPYLKGSYDLGDGSLLHVNRGSGTWGPPIRVASPPEITLIRFIRPGSD